MTLFNVSYLQYFCIIDNKRLDEWVPAERMDLTRLEQPKKDVKTPIKKGEGTAVVPRVANGGSNSRPSSPDREIVCTYFDAVTKSHVPESELIST